MYHAIVIAVLLLTFTIIVGDALFLRLLFRGPRTTSDERPTPPLLCRVVRLCVNGAGFLCFAAVAGTGFYTFLTNEKDLGGNWLIAHMTAAPAFALVAVAVVLLWSHRNRAIFGGDRVSDSAGVAIALRKLFFWIALATTVPTITSILLALFPLLTPAQQQSLFLIHRYCALPLVSSGSLFVYFALVAWRERRSS